MLPMHTDIVDLRQFYHSELGRMAEQSVSSALASIWARLPEERLLGLGYAVPYLERFRADTERTFAFMPAGQGAVNWPVADLSSTALVFDEELPLPDASIDRVLMVHSLEFAESPRETMKEIWRVLAPGGRLIIVVPNRRGVWAQMEHTPFGSGRPLFPRAADGALARDQLHARRHDGGALLSALEAQACPSAAPRSGTVRPVAVAGLFRGDHRRGAEAALSGPAGGRTRLAPRLRPGAGSAGRAQHAQSSNESAVGRSLLPVTPLLAPAPAAVTSHSTNITVPGIGWTAFFP